MSRTIYTAALAIITALSSPQSLPAQQTPAKGIGNLQVPPVIVKDTIPAKLLGHFTDDYGIRYSVSDSVWVQHPNVKYHILKWNTAEQYIIARNDNGNPSEPGLYTRIDYMYFTNMAPFQWGFCLTVYNAPTDAAAEKTAAADRQHPRKGCGGYPFSRMKTISN